MSYFIFILETATHAEMLIYIVIKLNLTKTLQMKYNVANVNKIIFNKKVLPIFYIKKTFVSHLKMKLTNVL